MTAIELIKEWEKLKLRAYPDPLSPLAKSIQAGKADFKLDGKPWTVGYGSTGPDIGPGTVWTEEQADHRLAERVAHDQHVIEAMLDHPATPNQTAAMLSLAYNIGLSNFEHSFVRHAFNNKDVKGAADAFLMWNKGHVNGQLVVVPGLVNRRYAERAVFLT